MLGARKLHDGVYVNVVVNASITCPVSAGFRMICTRLPEKPAVVRDIWWARSVTEAPLSAVPLGASLGI